MHEDLKEDTMHWNDIEDIVEALEDNFSDEDFPDNLSYLKEMVYSLQGFDDYEVEVDEEILKQILETWMEGRES